nr:terminase gpA endonuclease subunit [Photobacterium phosphoreum]
MSKLSFSALSIKPATKLSDRIESRYALSPRLSSRPGPVRLTNYQREILDVCGDDVTQDVVILAGAQVSKTQLMMWVAFDQIEYKGQSLLWVMPDKTIAELFVREKLKPNIFANRPVSTLYDDDNSRERHHVFRNNTTLAVLGTETPKDLNSWSAPLIIGDEVDRFNRKTGGAGDPVSLMKDRTETFHFRKHILVSTPMLTEDSLIMTEFKKTDQRHWCSPCPHCDELICFEPRDLNGNSLLKFERGHNGLYLPGSGRLICSSCNGLINENQRRSSIEDSRSHWKPTAEAVGGAVGFRMWAGISSFSSIDKICEKFCEATAKDNPVQKMQALQVVVNQTFGQTFSATSHVKPQIAALLARVEGYDAEVPTGVKFITLGSDVQHNRLEYVVLGWGLYGECWLVKYGVIDGSGYDTATYDELYDRCRAGWLDADGKTRRPSMAFLDAGDGNTTHVVLEWCQGDSTGIFYPIKGSGTPGYPYVEAPYHDLEERKIYRETPIVLGVNRLKERIYSSLRLAQDKKGYVHFPLETPRDFLEGLTSEDPKETIVKGVRALVFEHTRNVRNEKLDAWVYATAAAEFIALSDPTYRVILDPNYYKKEK